MSLAIDLRLIDAFDEVFGAIAPRATKTKNATLLAIGATSEVIEIVGCFSLQVDPSSDVFELNSSFVIQAIHCIVNVRAISVKLARLSCDLHSCH